MTQNQLVYIAGSGHSGSTLLDMLLGGHSHISSLGEVHRFWLNIQNDTQPHLCTCQHKVRECPFWAKVIQTIQTMLNSESLETFFTTDPRYLNDPELELRLEKLYAGKIVSPPKRLYPLSLTRVVMVIGSNSLWTLLSRLSEELRLYQSIIHNSLLLYEAVRQSWGTPIIIDSTKNPTRLKGLFLATDQPFRILRLVRDGRAVCYSRMRREKVTMEQAAKIWKAEQTKFWLAQLTIPNQIITTVHYENLARQPEQELSKLCHFLGIQFESLMLDFRSGNRHNLGGNPMRMRTDDTTIRLDEKWRRELTPTDIAVFDKIAGRLNRSLGYDK